MTVQITSSTSLPPGTTEHVPAHTPRWTLDGTPITHGGPSGDGSIGPAILAFDQIDQLTGDLTGTYWRTTTKPPVYIEASAVQAPAPRVAAFAGSFPADFDAAIAIPQDAGPDLALSVNEYAVLVDESAIVVSFVAEGARWMCDMIGNPDYQNQLYARLLALTNAVQRPDLNGMLALQDGGEINGQPVLPAITACQAEINRVELAGTNTGLGAYRTLDPATFLPALVHSEGVYVVGCPEVQAALESAKVAAQPTPTWAWKAEFARVWGPIVYQPGAYPS